MIANQCYILMTSVGILLQVQGETTRVGERQGSETRPATLAGTGLCYLASWTLMRFSTRCTPCTWLATDAAKLIWNGLPIRPRR